MTAAASDVELARLVEQLPAHARQGRLPRCALLTHGDRGRVAERLTALIAPGGLVTAGEAWLPAGFDGPRAVMLVDGDDRLLARTHQEALVAWWQAVHGGQRGEFPTWDLVWTARAGGTRALVLGVATAHEGELRERTGAERAEAGPDGRWRALADVSEALEAITPGWALTRAPPPFADQLAWAWKIASLGVPVVVACVGFLHATEVVGRDHWFLEANGWDRALRASLDGAVPAAAWGPRLPVGDAWLQLVTPATHVRLPRPCPRCGEHLRLVLRGVDPEDLADVPTGGEYVISRAASNDGTPEHWCWRCDGGARWDPAGR